MRDRIASLLLLVLVAVPVLATIWIGSKNTNFLTTILLLLFCAAMLPEVVGSVRRHAHEWRVRLIGIGTLLTVVAWSVLGRPFLVESRFWLYLGLVAFIPAFAAWWRRHGATGLRRLFEAKFLVTMVALVMVGYALATAPDASVIRNMPIYRNVRHMNYDLTVVLALTGFLAATTTRHRVVRVGLFASLVAMSFFAIWSGGRGQWLALAVVAVLLVATGRVRWRQHRLWMLPAAVVIGLVGVIASGRVALVSEQLRRTLTPESGALTSGRTQLWEVSLARVDDSVGALLFGYGPDAFDNLHLGEEVRLGPHQDFVHPHNAVIQWLLEFGLVGTAMVVSLCAWVAVRALRAVFVERDLEPLQRVVGALVIGLFAYAMTDGVLFHAIPLTVTGALVGFLVASRPDQGSRHGRHARNRSAATSPPRAVPA